MAETYINAQDLVEDVSLDGEEQFVMFDTEAGRRAKLKNIKEYINDQEYAKQASTAGEAAVATQLLGDQFRKNTALYTCRKTGGGKSVDKAEIIDKITGGTVSFNQLVLSGSKSGSSSGSTSESYVAIRATEVPTNHIVYLHAKGSVSASEQINFYGQVRWTTKFATNGVVDLIVDRGTGGPNPMIGISTGSSASVGSYSCSWDEFMVIDLTQMFGSTIADYILSLETSTAGAGVAFFKKLFDKPYYAYNAGAAKSVEGLSAHRTNGFNQWDEEWEHKKGYSTGTMLDEAHNIASKNYIPVIPNTTYFFKVPTGVNFYVYGYDADKNYIGLLYNPSGNLYETGDARFIKFATRTDNYSGKYNNDICINISSDRNGEYEPSNHRSYALDSSLVLRGMPKIVDGKLTYDGDEYYPDGRVTRKYGIVDLGTLTWDRLGNSRFETKIDAFKYETDLYKISNLICSKYETRAGIDSQTMDKGIDSYNAGPWVQIRDTSHADTSAADFKTAMSGVYLVYELATPTIEQAKPYTSMQACSPEGIEEFVYSEDSDVNVPVMTETRYPVDRATRADETTVLAADQLRSNSYTEESVPYRYRKAGGDVIAGGVKDECIVGGSVAWNQWIDNNWLIGGSSNGITVTANTSEGSISVTGTASADAQITFTANNLMQGGHAYYVKQPDGAGASTYFVRHDNGGAFWNFMNIGKPNGTASLRANVGMFVKSGQTVNFTFKPQRIDLTQMFGSTVADYIYNLEQSSAGAGVALFRSMFPEAYYEYNAGGLSSVEGLQKHVTSGFNQWDEEWELGSISSSGQPESSAYRIRTKNYIPVLPNTTYYIKWGTYGSGRGAFYDADKNLIWYSSDFYRNQTFTTPQNARYMKFSPSTDYGTTYKNDICINLSGDRNGEYEPYKKHSYALDSSIILRGVPKVVNGKICFDGDEYYPDGRVKRKYGVVDLGTLSWVHDYFETQDVHRFQGTMPSDYKKPAGYLVTDQNIVCAKYLLSSAPIGLSKIDKTISGYTGSAGIYIIDQSYSDAATFKTAMNGVYLVYELATPTTETADAYVGTQACDEYGTEEYISTSICPVGHKTKYYDNLTKRITKLPSTIAPVERSAISSANYAVGDYLILNNTLYKVTSAITTGGTITPGSNVTATTIMAEIKALR